MKKVILASTSTVFGGNFIEYLLQELNIHFQGVSEIAFISFTKTRGIIFSEYVDKVKLVFKSINIDIKGLHKFDN